VIAVDALPATTHDRHRGVIEVMTVSVQGGRQAIDQLSRKCTAGRGAGRLGRGKILGQRCW
jgi:hypothetical protein